MERQLRIVVGEDAARECLDLAEGCGLPSKRVPSDRRGFDAGTKREVSPYAIALRNCFRTEEFFAREQNKERSREW